MHISPTGRFFRALQENGVWWLIDPSGRKFLSKGVCAVRYEGSRIRDTTRAPYAEANQAKYGSIDAWRDAAAHRLHAWGFNTLGSWSDPGLAAIDIDGARLAYAHNLDLGSTFVSQRQQGENAWLHGIFPDVFDPAFEVSVRARALDVCSPKRDDPSLLGWFTDNELRWGPDWRGRDELLTLFLALPRESAGREAAITMLQERHGTIAAMNVVWGTSLGSWDDLRSGGPVQPPFVRVELYAQNEGVERTANEENPRRAAYIADCEAFLGLLAERYFRITHDAIKAADPNHLNFGSRFAYVPPLPVVAAAAKYVDVVSFNCYDTDPRNAIRQYAAFEKPLIIGEFSFRAHDSGLPNTHGAGPCVQTQAERARAFQQYVTWALENPHLVGYHWFMFVDQPAEGRFDGENSNYGIVDIRDNEYEVLARAMTETNRNAEILHASA